MEWFRKRSTTLHESVPLLGGFYPYTLTPLRGPLRKCHLSAWGAPKLAGSLLSVGQLTAIPGVKLEFEGNHCLVKLRGETLCQASFKGGLYTLDLANPVSSADRCSPSVLKAKTPAPAGKRLDILTLHRRLGQVNISDLRKLVASKMVDGLDMGIDGWDFSCDACLLLYRGRTLLLIIGV